MARRSAAMISELNSRPCHDYNALFMYRGYRHAKYCVAPLFGRKGGQAMSADVDALLHHPKLE
jgi:hypothetical protein